MINYGALTAQLRRAFLPRALVVLVLAAAACWALAPDPAPVYIEGVNYAPTGGL